MFLRDVPVDLREEGNLYNDANGVACVYLGHSAVQGSIDHLRRVH